MLFFFCFKKKKKKKTSFPHLLSIVIATSLFIKMNLIVLFDTIINSKAIRLLNPLHSPLTLQILMVNIDVRGHDQHKWEHHHK